VTICCGAACKCYKINDHDSPAQLKKVKGRGPHDNDAVMLKVMKI